MSVIDRIESCVSRYQEICDLDDKEPSWHLAFRSRSYILVISGSTMTVSGVGYSAKEAVKAVERQLKGMT